MKQIPLGLGPETAPRVDDLVPGANALALAHLKTLKPGAGLSMGTTAPVYVWGDSGTGKSHVLRALARRWQEEGAHLGSFNASDTVPWPFDESWSLILLDDCDQLDTDQQQAAFALFVEAISRGVTVVAAGRVPPVDLPLRDDLRTRLGWGHVLALSPLNEAETRAAVRHEADRRGIFLSDEVMDYLLTRFTRDLKHLMHLLDRLDEFALSHKRQVTVPLLKKMLTEEPL